ncbi:MAG: peptidase [Rhizobiales bacterium]|nr:peptidase [Hyphomicrobiales bacterium]MBG18658.1 peptidase [Hyphomicrobiales bacterium]
MFVHLRRPCAILSALLSASFPALAWEPQEKIATYTVRGGSGAELYEEIGAKGPVIGDGRRTVAHTTFKLTWRRDYQPRVDGSCVLAGAVPRLVITYTLPEAAGSLSPQLAASWKTFRDGLLAHEKVHGRHITEMVEMIQAMSIGLRAEADPGCQKVRAKLQGHLKELSDEQRARGREFDRKEMGQGGNIQQLILALIQGP